MIDGEISEVSLKNYKGQYVILFFYPKVQLDTRSMPTSRLSAYAVVCSVLPLLLLLLLLTAFVFAPRISLLYVQPKSLPSVSGPSSLRS